MNEKQRVEKLEEIILEEERKLLEEFCKRLYFVNVKKGEEIDERVERVLKKWKRLGVGYEGRPKEYNEEERRRLKQKAKN